MNGKILKLDPIFLVMREEDSIEFCIRTEKEFFKTGFVMSLGTVSNGETIYHESVG
jgi:hypothetical protein